MDSDKGKMPKIVVHIIESGAPDDILMNRLEGSALRETLNLLDIPVTYHQVVNEAMLARAFEQADEWYTAAGLGDERADDALQVLHISAHGNKAGIVTTSDEQVTWVRLKELVRGYSESSGEDVLLSLSSCNGYNAWRLIAGPEFGVVSIVGPKGKPTWQETVVGFQTFYHHLISQDELNLDSAVGAMRVASIHTSFDHCAPDGARLLRVVRRLKGRKAS